MNCAFVAGFNTGLFNSMFNPFGNSFCTPMFGFNPFYTFSFMPPIFSVPTFNPFCFNRYNDINPFPQMDFKIDFSNINFSNIFTPNFQTAPIDFNFNNSYIAGFDTFERQSTVEKPPKTGGDVGKRPLKTNITAKTWDKMSDEEMREIYGNYDYDITSKYTGTAEKLNSYLKGKGVLEGKGQAFIDAQNEYGICASVLVGICMNESGSGRSNLAKNNKNVGGVRVPGSTEFKKYSSVDDCIKDIARFLKSGYVDKGLTKLYQVNAKYCPISDPTDTRKLNNNWASNVNKFTKDVDNLA